MMETITMSRYAEFFSLALYSVGSHFTRAHSRMLSADLLNTPSPFADLSTMSRYASKFVLGIWECPVGYENARVLSAQRS